MKRQLLGPGADESMSITFLGRLITWDHHGVKIESDPKIVEALLTEWDMLNSKGVVSPGVKETVAETNHEEAHLVGPDVSTYRRAVARLKYMSIDRQGLAFATKELAFKQSSPTGKDVVRLKRVLRYLKRCPRAYTCFNWQRTPARLFTNVAGCNNHLAMIYSEGTVRIFCVSHLLFRPMHTRMHTLLNIDHNPLGKHAVFAGSHMYIL